MVPFCWDPHEVYLPEHTFPLLLIHSLLLKEAIALLGQGKMGQSATFRSWVSPGAPGWPRWKQAASQEHIESCSKPDQRTGPHLVFRAFGAIHSSITANPGDTESWWHCPEEWSLEKDRG